MLRPALADPLILLHHLDHPPALRHVVAYWLLHIHVLARLHRPDRRQSMPMIRRGHRHHVDRLVVEDLSHILDPLRIVDELLGNLGPNLPIAVAHVADEAVVTSGQRFRVRLPPTTNSNHRHTQPLVRALRLLFLGHQRTSGGSGQRARCGQHRLFKKTTATRSVHDPNLGGERGKVAAR